MTTIVLYAHMPMTHRDTHTLAHQVYDYLNGGIIVKICCPFAEHYLTALYQPRPGNPILAASSVVSQILQNQQFMNQIFKRNCYTRHMS